jgi:hypothetical protein
LFFLGLLLPGRIISVFAATWRSKAAKADLTSLRINIPIKTPLVGQEAYVRLIFRGCFINPVFLSALYSLTTRSSMGKAKAAHKLIIIAIRHFHRYGCILLATL